MKVIDFISLMRNEFDCEYDDIILQWLELNASLGKGSERELEAELDDTARALCYVKNNFDKQTLKTTLTYPTLANEVISCAVLFRANQPLEVVKGYAERGRIECGYIPKTFDEKGTLSLVHCAGTDSSVFLCHGFSIDEMKDKIEQVFDKSKEVGVTAGIILDVESLTDSRIYPFGRDVIGTYMLNMFNMDKECSAFGCLVQCLPNVGIVTADMHPSLLSVETEESPCDDELQGLFVQM
ncbi:MAG: hypothetical protein IJB65_00760 [Clostridia bacterium]|nr:hypothetical protein [Clostridia bacterium]